MPNNNKSRTINGALWSQIGKTLEFLISFLLSIILARGMGPLNYGIYTSIIAFLSIFEMASSFGLEQTLSNYIPRYYNQGRLNEIGGMIRRAIILRASTLSIIFIILSVFYKQVSEGYFQNSSIGSVLFVSCIYVLVRNLSNLMSYLYIGVLNIRLITIANLISLLCLAIIAFILLKIGYGLSSIFISFSLVYFLVLLLYILKAREVMYKKNIANDFKRERAFAKTIWVNNLLAYILGKQSDIFLLQLFKKGAKQIGFYNIAFSLNNMAGSILMSGIGTISLAVMSTFNKDKEIKKLAKMWKIMVSISTILSIPIYLIIIMNVDNIIHILYGNEYSGTEALLRMFAIFSIIGRLFGGGCNTTLLYSLDREKTILNVTILTGILNLVLNLFLVPNLGALGALLSTGISNLTTTIVLFVISIKTIELNFPCELTLKVMFAAFISSLVTKFINPIGYDGILFLVIIYLIIYVSILFILKPFRMEEIKGFQSVKKVYFIISHFAKN